MKFDPDRLDQITTQNVLPVELAIAGSQPLLLKQLVREVPTKRYVYFGRYSGQDVIVKCFFGAKTREARSELRGWRLLKAANIRTASLIWHDITKDVAVLIYEFIPGESLADVYRHDPFALLSNKTWFLVLFDQLIQLHKAKLVQDDFHLGNFILCGTDVIAIDAATIKPVNTPQALIENFALFIAQFYARNIESPESLIARYQDQFTTTSIDVSAFSLMLKQVREKRLYKKLSKSLRDCTQYKRINGNSFSGMCLRREEAAIMAMINSDIDDLILHGERLKSGNSATVAMVMVADKQYVVKRYNQKNALILLKRQFKVSRAKTSWLAANWLLSIGVRTPQPIGYLEKTSGLVKRQAYFITEYIAGVDLATHLHDDHGGAPYLNDLRYLFNMMQYYQFSHGDLKASNLLVCNDQLWLIDLDAMQLRMRSGRFQKKFTGDKYRLLQNWQADSSKSDLIERIIS